MNLSFNRSFCIIKTIFILLCLVVFELSAEDSSSQSIGSTVKSSEQRQDDNVKITGKVTDEQGEGMPGVTIRVKGKSVGTVTDISGNYSLIVPRKNSVLVFSFIGYISTEIPVKNEVHDVVLKEEVVGLDEVVVVGYGTQKKASTVAAISQVTSENLVKSGGVTNVAQALTGRMPGVTMVTSTGEPGGEDPTIYVRGRGTWNNSQPLILVDGIERKMSDIDVNEVETISVLKDASATAVYGVKGAEGVILITTRRGKEGKPVITFDTNLSTRDDSKVAKKLNSYDQFIYRNNTIEYELDNPIADYWSQYTPMRMVQYYKQPQPNGLQYLFPDVNWASEMIDPFPVSSRVNFNISGGSNFAKYFGSLGYTYEDDMLKSGTDPMNAGYKASNAYSRINFRTNLDLNITSTTTLSTNIGGYISNKRSTVDNTSLSNAILQGFAGMSPDLFPIYQFDGSYGYNFNANTTRNPVRALNSYGISQNRVTSITTDFILKQDLDFITKGLSARLSVSYDNLYTSVENLNDNGTDNMTWINPNLIEILQQDANGSYIDANGKFILKEGYTYDDFLTYVEGYLKPGGTGYDYNTGSISYSPETATGESSNTTRRMFMQAQLNWARTFGKHDVSGLAVLNREQYAKGSMFPRYREDWVGRITYGYDERYFFESNFAYNGSERFAPGKRFGFFPSVGLGWMLTNEKFMKSLDPYLSKLKVRYSIGKVGNDTYSSDRWGYMTNWALHASAAQMTKFGYPQITSSPYTQYIESGLGNPDLTWETSVKQNIGIETGFFKNKLSLNLEVYRDDRSGIFMSAGQRTTTPSYFGAKAVAANLGETEVKGYEFEAAFRDKIGKSFHYYLTFNHTGAFDKIIYREDAPLLPAYRKLAGYSINTKVLQQDRGIAQNWDDVYSATIFEKDNPGKLPGDYRIIDFNADGIINIDDNAPYSYPVGRPQHTYGWTIGFDYKGFSLMTQFYGVYNVLMEYIGTFRWPFYGNSLATGPVIAGYQANSWNPNNTDTEIRAMRLKMETQPGQGTLAYVDGSYLRLKYADLGYTFNNKFIKNLGMNSLKVYLNGSNLLFWSDVVEDREEIGGSNTNVSNYPIPRRYNLGIKITF